jgi:phosphoribosylaminoimidazole (AIR) synthetase
MGIGYVLIVPAREAGKALKILGEQRTEAVAIGLVEKGSRGVVFSDKQR